ncbi:unnamed protein product [Musa textilis]
MNGRSSGASRLSRCMKAPIRMLCRACDFYVRSMNSCAGRVPQGGALGYTMTTTLPRSFSVQSGRTSMSGDDDLQELIRASSVSRTGGGRFDLKGASPQQPAVVPRSQSVAIGRIDEDKPCDFGDDVKLGSDFLFPRSRSYAVAPRRRVAAFA